MKTWLGMGLLLAGLMVGVYPRLPATPRRGGSMQGVPQRPWTAAGVAGLGVVLLLLGRGRDRVERP